LKIFNSVNIGEDICIDPGTEYISVYIKGKGTVLREPSVVAYNSNTNEVIAVGEEAAQMEGRAPQCISTIRPIEYGVVVDFDFAAELFAGILAKVKKNAMIKPKITLSVPCGITDVEEKAVINAIMKAGARQVIVVESPVAAALGAGCDITLARGLMVLDIGAGKCDMAAISLCKTVISRTIKTGGRDFTYDIKEHIKNKYNLTISYEMADKIKKEVVSADGISGESIDVSGIDTNSSLPRRIRISSIDTQSIFESRINAIALLIKDTLDSVPPELLGDIMSDGILLVGGGAKLSGLADILTRICGIKLFPASDIDLCNIKGTGIAMENPDSLPDIAQSYHNL